MSDSFLKHSKEILPGIDIEGEIGRLVGNDSHFEQFIVVFLKRVSFFSIMFNLGFPFYVRLFKSAGDIALCHFTDKLKIVDEISRRASCEI